jgi:1-pyrroline-5-carboxylate dehydrogenase
MTPFKNEVVWEFKDEAQLANQKEAIEKVRASFGKEYPNYINGKESFTDKKTKSYNPSNKEELIGTFQKAGQKEAEEAHQAAQEAFKTWSRVPASERAEYLFKAAQVIRDRRYEINAWMISEAGKNYVEADADTCEAIDFLEFYGREMIRYSQKQELTRVDGEDNDYFYIPLGVGVVVPPWNFPFAILVGMTSAAIVSGNTVVLKPSSDTPMMGWLFADIMNQLGLPAGVINFLVASGAETGDYLVDHPKTRFISFTGSMEVGIRINERAAKVNPGQIWLKRVVAEMGGKDAMIIDSEYSDLEFAADQVVKAAFGFQGQKCSAGSRAIIDQAIWDKLVPMIIEKTKALTIGDAKDNYAAGPVINEGAYNSIMKYIEIGSKEGKLLYGGADENKSGWYIKPTVIETGENDTIAKEEIFGPVLSLIKSRDFEHSVEIFNSTIYGLTGGLMTDNEEKLERARLELHCGNLYLNRKCTGALVDVHPFGGFNMSGTDSKAGSRDYLLLFMQGKTVTRKVK